MNYVCLAAGKGTRFGQLGSYLQKCMYPVGLRPFLEHSLQNLRASRCLNLNEDSLLLVVGHYGEQVRSYFGKEYEGLSLRYAEQPEALGTGHALHLAYQTLGEEPLIAWLADAYVPAEVFEAVYAHPEANVQTVGPGHAEEKDDLRVTADGSLITRAWRGEDRLYDVGIWKLSPEVLALMTTLRHGEYRAMPNLQYALEAGHRIGCVRVGEWVHLGGTLPTPEDNVLAVTRRVLELDAAR